MTTSRADKTTSSTTLAASPAGIQGASSPPLISIHQSARNNAIAATNAPKRYPALEGIFVREARLCDDSTELCTRERAALGKKSFAELLSNCIPSRILQKRPIQLTRGYWPGRKSIVRELRQTL